MAKYRLDAPHFFDGAYREAGEIVECDPKNKSRRMTLVAPEAEPEAEAAAETEAEAEPEATADEIANAVANIMANPKDGDLTPAGRPKKAAIEEYLGVKVPQALFMAAIN